MPTMNKAVEHTNRYPVQVAIFLALWSISGIVLSIINIDYIGKQVALLSSQGIFYSNLYLAMIAYISPIFLFNFIYMSKQKRLNELKALFLLILSFGFVFALLYLTGAIKLLSLIYISKSGNIVDLTALNILIFAGIWVISFYLLKLIDKKSVKD